VEIRGGKSHGDGVVVLAVWWWVVGTGGDSVGVRAWEGDVKTFVSEGRFRNWRVNVNVNLIKTFKVKN
jgi:hypothetical protein